MGASIANGCAAGGASSMSRIASTVPGTSPLAAEWTEGAWRSVAAAPAATLRCVC